MSEDVYTEIQVTVFVSQRTDSEDKIQKGCPTHCNKTTRGILKTKYKRIEEDVHPLKDISDEHASTKAQKHVRFGALPSCNRVSRNKDFSSLIRQSRITHKGGISSKKGVRVSDGNHGSSFLSKKCNEKQSNSKTAYTSPTKISFAEYCGRKQKQIVQDNQTIYKEKEYVTNTKDKENPAEEPPEMTYVNTEIYNVNTSANQHEYPEFYKDNKKLDSVQSYNAKNFAQRKETRERSTLETPSYKLKEKLNEHYKKRLMSEKPKEYSNDAKSQLMTDLIYNHSDSGKPKLNTHLISEKGKDLKEVSDLPKMKRIKVEKILDDKKIVYLKEEQIFKENKYAIKGKDKPTGSITQKTTMTEDALKRNSSEDTRIVILTDDTLMPTLTANTQRLTATKDTEMSSLPADKQMPTLTEDAMSTLTETKLTPTLTENKPMPSLTETTSMHTIIEMAVDNQNTSIIDIQDMANQAGQISELSNDQEQHKKDLKDSTTVQNQIIDVAQSIRNFAKTLSTSQTVFTNLITAVNVKKLSKQSYRINAECKNSLLNKSGEACGGTIYDQDEYKCSSSNTSAEIASSCGNDSLEDIYSSSNTSEEQSIQCRTSDREEDGNSYSTVTTDDDVALCRRGLDNNKRTCSRSKIKRKTECSLKRKRSDNEQYKKESAKCRKERFYDRHYTKVKKDVGKRTLSVNHRYKSHSAREKHSPMARPKNVTEKRTTYSKSRHKKYENRLSDDDNSDLRHRRTGSQSRHKKYENRLPDDDNSDLRNGRTGSQSRHKKYENRLPDDDNSDLRNGRTESQSRHKKYENRLSDDDNSDLRNRRTGSQSRHKKYESRLSDDDNSDLRNRGTGSQSRHKKYESRLSDDDNSDLRNRRTGNVNLHEGCIKLSIHEEDSDFYSENTNHRLYGKHNRISDFYESQICVEDGRNIDCFHDYRNPCRISEVNYTSCHAGNRNVCYCKYDDIDNRQFYKDESNSSFYGGRDNLCSSYDEPIDNDHSSFSAYRRFCFMKGFHILKQAALSHFVRSEQRLNLTDYDIKDFEYRLMQGIKRTLDRFIFNKDPLLPKFLSKKIMTKSILETIRTPNERNGRRKHFHLFNYVIGYVENDTQCYWCEVQFTNGHLFQAKPITFPY